MGIWIRSQDKKKLVNCEWFMSDKWGGDKFAITGDCGVPYDTGESVLLGIYSPEAEAMQVLDMIQERILEFEGIRLAGPERFTGYVGNVFQMPPAGFSEPEKKQVAKLEQDLDLYKEALAIVLDSSDYLRCDNCPLEGCSKEEAGPTCVSDLHEHFLEEARDSIARAEGGR